MKPKWSEAFRAKVYELTGSEEFTYVTAVTKVKGHKECWENYQPFLDRIKAPIKVVTFKEMLDELWTNSTKTVAPSDIGRTLQLIKASGWQMQS